MTGFRSFCKGFHFPGSGPCRIIGIVNRTGKKTGYILQLLFIAASALILLALLVVYFSRTPEPVAEPAAVRLIPGDESFPVYGVDPDDMRLEIEAVLRIPREERLEEKLRLLGQALSRTRFGGLPLELVRIDREQGRVFALFDLREDPGREAGWRDGYFQGSTGGQATFRSLTETLLQRRYPGEWVYGIAFTYEGKRAEPLDHIDLSGIFYRAAPENADPGEPRR